MAFRFSAYDAARACVHVCSVGFRRSATARGVFMSCEGVVPGLAGHVSDSARLAATAAVRYGDRGWEGFDGPLGGEGDWLGGEMGWRVLLGTGAGAVVGDDMTMGWR